MPDSQRAPIWHPERDDHTLEREAAAAWNTLRLCADTDGVELYAVDKPGAAYRTYARQRVLLRRYLEGRGNPASRPGRSNHGLGVAIDLDTRRMRSWLDRNGSDLGWAKRWSDAPAEWWHIRYRPGVWEPRPDPGPIRGSPVLREGSGGRCQAAWVRRLQRLLRHELGPVVAVDGRFDEATRDALVAFERKRGLPADGIADAETWRALRPSLDPPAAARETQSGGPSPQAVNGERPAATAAPAEVPSPLSAVAALAASGGLAGWALRRRRRRRVTAD